MTTKEEERNALEKIKKIVESLGKESYLRTAFDGAFELAEQNIDYDFGNSTRWYVEEYQNLCDKFETANKRIDELQNELDEQKSAHYNERNALNRKLLSDYETATVEKLLSEKTSELQLELNNAASRIVDAADDPQSDAFSNAVADHRTAKTEFDRYSGVLRSIAAKGEIV